MRELKRTVLHVYFTIRTWWPLWFYVLNRIPRALHAAHPPTLTPTEENIVRNLSTTGIAVSSLDELFPNKNILQQLQTYAASLEHNAKQRTKKAFLEQYWEVIPQLDPSNPFVQFAMEKPVRTIVNSYMHMWTKLKTFTLIKTVPVHDSSPTQSQCWHRDPEEKRMCKVFIYLTDVDEQSGPFIYIPESPFGMKWGNLFPQRTPEGIYPDTKELEQHIPKSAHKVFTGKAGTVIFCDTSGLHKGGYAKEKERLMFTAFYSAPTFSEAPRYVPPTKDVVQAIEDPSLRYALTHP
jgi:hypothetical protein